MRDIVQPSAEGLQSGALWGFEPLGANIGGHGTGWAAMRDGFRPAIDLRADQPKGLSAEMAVLRSSAFNTLKRSVNA